MIKFKLYSQKILPGLLVSIILASMAWLGFGSSQQDSLTVDESPHIVAGYSYILKKDYRLNPEHPPLLKLLSGVSVWVGSKITGTAVYFPDSLEAWRDKVNAQWDMGYAFLFQAGNDFEMIIWWARLPNIILMLALGLYLYNSIYFQTKHRGIALLGLVLYAFSANVIAHGRLVTTDLIAAFGFVAVIDTWLRYLKAPSWKTITLVWLALSLALLSKFSTILLIPILGLSGFGYIAIQYWKNPHLWQKLGILVRDSSIIGLGVILSIHSVYFFTMQNMPLEKQLQLVEESFPQENTISIYTRSTLNNIITTPGLRYLGQYLLGQAMVAQRVGGGNTTFLLGQFTNQSFRYYFPITYLLKESLVIIILLLTILVVLIGIIIQYLKKKSYNIDPKLWLNHCYEITILAMIILYWGISIQGNLNLGIRHILPALILTYILLAIGIVKILIPLGYSRYILGLMAIWYIAGAFLTYPNYISHLNMLVKSGHGHQVFTDSNLDWGQDLKKLNAWAKSKAVKEIYIDYFGTANVSAYLKDVKAIPIKSNQGPKFGYVVISATMFQDSFYLHQQDAGYQDYWWLKWREPDYQISESLLIYQVSNY